MFLVNAVEPHEWKRQNRAGAGNRVNIVITSVDHAPDDLDDQVPIRATLIRMLEGTDSRGRRYWLAELETPISWRSNEGSRTISHLLIAARWLGTAIEPGASIPINICYVTNDAILSAPVLDLGHAQYVAIGSAKVRGASFWSRLRDRLRSTR